MTTRLVRWMLNYQGKKIVTAYCTPSKYKLYSLSPVVIERIDIGFSYKCQIRFSHNRSGVKYIYTLDGSEPTLSNGTVIENDTIELASNCTIRAIAIIESRHVIEISASISSMSIADLKLPLVSFGLDKYDGFEIKNLIGSFTDSSNNKSISSLEWDEILNRGNGAYNSYDNPIDIGNIYVAGHKYYTTCKFRILDGSEYVIASETISRYFPNATISRIEQTFTENTEYRISKIITLNERQEGKETSLYPVVIVLNGQGTPSAQYKEAMLIDVTELEEAYPYFAELSDNEQKEILDTLPFFQDRFEL